MIYMNYTIWQNGYYIGGVSASMECVKRLETRGYVLRRAV